MCTIIRSGPIRFWGALFLLFFGVAELQSIAGDWVLTMTPGQKLCGIGQVILGFSGVLAGVGAILRRQWAVWVGQTFVVSAGITAGMASVAWGETNLITGIASGGLGLIVGILPYWGITERVPVGIVSPTNPIEPG